MAVSPSPPSSLADLTLDKEELHNVVTKFPKVGAYMEEQLRSIVAYPKVSQAVQLYNKQQFISWRKGLGGYYSKVIANLRWHVDWQRDMLANEKAVVDWLNGI